MKKVSGLLTLALFCAFAIQPILSAIHASTIMPVQGPPDSKGELTLPTHFDTTKQPLRDMFPDKAQGNPRGGRDFEPGRPDAVGHTNPAGVDELAAKSSGFPSSATAITAAIGGTGVGSPAVAPPDTTGDLGPNHYVQWVNLRYAVYNVTRDANNQISGFSLASGFPKNGNVVWQGFGGPCEQYNDGDPIVQYDQLSGRWVLTQFAVSSAPYTQCVAVSTSGDPTGTYHRYAYSYGNDFNDYPKMGVWPDGYYITYNMFRRGRTFTGSKVCAFERDKMLIGASARQICANTSSSYGSLLPADLEGNTLPPSGSPNLLMSISSTAVQFWRYSVNWTAGTGSLTGPTTVPGVAAFSRACGGGTCIPQNGTTRTLDSLADRLMYRLSYRNFGDHESLLVNHSVATGGVSGVRWYELRDAAGATQTLGNTAPVLYQQGTYAPTADYRWMGSAAMDKTGGIAIGYNVSSSAIKPGIRYAFRAPGDTLGTLGAEQTILNGPGAQTGTLSRWGDYSMMSVDPVDGCTMVFTTEYIPTNGSFNWSTYIYSFKLSSCTP